MPHCRRTGHAVGVWNGRPIPEPVYDREPVDACPCCGVVIDRRGVSHELRPAPASTCSREPTAGLTAEEERLVNHWVKRYAGWARAIGVDRRDLTQAAHVAVLEGRREWRKGGGAAYSTYISSKIRGSLRTMLRAEDHRPRPDEDAAWAEPSHYEGAYGPDAPDELVEAVRNLVDPAEVRRAEAALPTYERLLIRRNIGLGGFEATSTLAMARTLGIGKNRLRDDLRKAKAMLRYVIDEARRRGIAGPVTLRRRA